MVARRVDDMQMTLAPPGRLNKIGPESDRTGSLDRNRRGVTGPRGYPRRVARQRTRDGSASGATPATRALIGSGLRFTEFEYTHQDGAEGYGREAAEALGVDQARVFKTLIVQLPDGSLAVGVVPVSGHLDLKAIGAALGVKKVEMADPARAERSSGYVTGGISPLGQRRALPTVLDAGAMRFETIWVSGGRRGLSIGLAPADLVSATSASVAEIATA